MMMKPLKEILSQIGPHRLIGPLSPMVQSLTIDSRQVVPGTLFCAMPGTQIDGHRFIDQAINQGATVILCHTPPTIPMEGVTFIIVDDVPLACGLLASAFYDHPSKNIKLVGVTGTNGKTTTVTLLFQLFTSLGYPCGLLSTIHNQICQQIIPTQNTTPDVITINALLAQMIEQGCTHAFMEVSSHAVVQQRIAGLTFTGGVFTNLTHDHLDYHQTFDAYLDAKRRFFDALSPQAFALTNIDDRNGLVMLQHTQAKRLTYSLSKMADFKAQIVEADFEGMQVQLSQHAVWTPLVGRFNAYNFLAIYATATLLGEDSEQVLTALSKQKGAKGRFEVLRAPSAKIGIVDYAHTPDALENVLQTIVEVRQPGQQIICVIGCGGDRDRSKRPLMAAIGLKYSHRLILSSDNPRSEDPEAIIQDMLKGIPEADRNKVLSIVSREEAIKTACMLAQPKDVVLVAGKGHETYQEIRGVRNHFDDHEKLDTYL